MMLGFVINASKPETVEQRESVERDGVQNAVTIHVHKRDGHVIGHVKLGKAAGRERG